MYYHVALLYNLSMPLPRVARILPIQVVGPNLPDLGRVLPPDLLIGLLQHVNSLSDHPRRLANQLITRSGCRLRQLQHATPALRISLRALLAARRSQGRKAALIQALVEFYVGLILLILFPDPPRALYPRPKLGWVSPPRLAPARFPGRARPVIPH
jgi:hypothetical protein